MTIEIDTVETYNTWDVTGEEEARATWAALPVREAYPVGSRWLHPSDNRPVTITGYEEGTDNVMVSSPDRYGPDPVRWDRSALDNYGRPALPETEAETPITFREVTEEEGTMTEFTKGDRVRIIEVGHGLAEDWEGMEATYVGPSPSGRTTHPHEVAFDVDFTARGFSGDDGLQHGYVTRIEKVDSTPADFYVGQRVEVFGWENGESTWNGPATVERVDSGYVTVLPDTGEFANVPGGFSRDHLRPLAEEATEETAEPVEAAPEPYRASVGDRVIVTEDRDAPRDQGKPATVLIDDGSLYQVRYDHDGRTWWVQEVRPLMPSTPEEMMAWLEEAKAKAKQEVLDEEASRIREARKEGRDAATQEAAEHMEKIVESAHAYAARNELCRQFDLFMVENGLRPRDTFTQRYEVTIDTFSVRARNEEEAFTEALQHLREIPAYQVNVELSE